MKELADPDVGSSVTRWEEMKKTVQIIIEAHAVVQTVCDIYFINREGAFGVTDWNQVAHLFAPPPAGGTNLVAVLSRIQVTTDIL